MNCLDRELLFSPHPLKLPILFKLLSLKWPMTSLGARAGCLWSLSLPPAGYDSLAAYNAGPSACLLGYSIPSVVTSLPSRLRAGRFFPFLPLCRLLPSLHPAKAFTESNGCSPWSDPHIYTTRLQLTFPLLCHLQLNECLDSSSVLLSNPLRASAWFLLFMLPISFFLPPNLTNQLIN